MKQFQFEYKNYNNLRRELSRVKRFCKNAVGAAVYFQIFTQLIDLSSLKPITDTLEQEFPEASYYGCQTFGNIIDGSFANDSTVILCTVFELESTKTKLLFIDSIDWNNKMRSLDDLWKFCNENEWVKAVELTGAFRSGELLGIGKKPIELREDIQVYGGMAINPESIPSDVSYVFTKKNGFSTTGVIALVMGGEDLHIDCNYIVGWERLGKSFEITDCDGRVIHSIDNEPAFDIYRKYLGVKKGADFVSSAMQFPLLVEQNGIECIRIPEASENEKDIILSIEVENGTKIRLCYGDKDTILSRISSRVKDIAAFSPDGIKIYSCALRRLFWGDDRVSLETEKFDEIAPSVGFYTKGELLRIGNYLYYFNATIVTCLIREGNALESGYSDVDMFADIDNSSSLASGLISYVSAVTGEIESQYNRTILGLANIYRSMLFIDLKENILSQYDCDSVTTELLAEETEPNKQILNLIGSVVKPEYYDMALSFCDLTTLVERCQNKAMIDCELVSIHSGWFRAQFIVISRDEGGVPTQFVFTTQIINAQKQKEEYLLKTSFTDKLTEFYNRRAYENDSSELKKCGLPENFSFISLDLNGLKAANDNLGHAAGDELITGAAYCMKRCFGHYGKLYRVGGDEFAAVLCASDEQLKEILSDFDETVMMWEGKLVNELSISYGAVFPCETACLSCDDTVKLADERMYSSKDNYYRRKGVDRRGQSAAYAAICSECIKILRVNLSDDSYNVIKMDENELAEMKEGMSFSEILISFGKSGNVHPDDLERYLSYISKEHFDNYFRGGRKSLILTYRRRRSDVYRNAVLEMIASDKYTDDNREFFLYVREYDI